MGLRTVLEPLDECLCRVGREGLYIVDGIMTMIVTNWKEDPLWKEVGEATLKFQGESTGVFLAQILDGHPEETDSEMPGFGALDKRIKNSYREGAGNLMAQYDQGLVIIKITSYHEYVVFNNEGEDLYLPMPYISVLAEMGARLKGVDEDDTTISFNAPPGIVGFLKKEEPEWDMPEGANEDVGSCNELMSHFEDHYAKVRKTPEFRYNRESTDHGLKESFLETLHQISGYERNGDSDLDRRVEGMAQEIFPLLHLRQGLQFQVRGRGAHWEVAHPDRILFLENNGGGWSVFVADWDNGYEGPLGTHYPITRESADHLKARMPGLEVKS